jgi:deglycase
MATWESAKVAFLAAAEGTEQVELTRPWEAVRAQGGRPVLVSPASGKIQMFNHLDRGDVMNVDLSPGDADKNDYLGLVLPGGVANPDQLRMDPDAVEFARSFFTAGKPVAVICHGPWTLIEADVVLDRTLTSWPSLKTDLRNAGATWLDQEVITCTSGPNALVSSRRPDDLPAFCETFTRVFGEQL